MTEVSNGIWPERDTKLSDVIAAAAKDGEQTIEDGSRQKFFVEVVPAEAGVKANWNDGASLTEVLNKAAPDDNRRPESGAPQVVALDEARVAIVRAGEGVYRNSRSGPDRFIT